MVDERARQAVGQPVRPDRQPLATGRGHRDDEHQEQCAQSTQHGAALLPRVGRLFYAPREAEKLIRLTPPAVDRSTSVTIEIISAADPDPAVIARAAAAVGAGGVVAYPTDTFYALGADPRRSAGVSAIFAMKGRREGEALPLIAGSLGEVERALGPFEATARRLAMRFWPGPLTLVVPLVQGVLDPRVTAGHATVAVRVPDHAVARALATAIGGLITSTSANRSGAPPAVTAADVAHSLSGSPLFILDGGPAPGGLVSTIVDVSEAQPRLVRAGRVPFDRVLESLQ